MRQSNRKPQTITPQLLRRRPLPVPEEGDKEARGRALVVGGAPEMPGAVILAANAALRAGAGKLQIATCASIAPFVGIAVPEALVLALAQTQSGSLARQAGATVAEHAGNVGALLIGPGMAFDDDTDAVVQQAITGTQATVILDAAGLKVLKTLPDLLHSTNGNAVLTPHAGEMAGLLKRDKQQILEDPLRCVCEAARKFGPSSRSKGREPILPPPAARCIATSAATSG